jgi:hypothetical protein
LVLEKYFFGVIPHEDRSDDPRLPGRMTLPFEKRVRRRRRSHVRNGSRKKADVLYRSSVPETAMPQINFHTTVEFELDLLALMMAARIPTKSEAIRHAVHELAAAYGRRGPGEEAGRSRDATAKD